MHKAVTTSVGALMIGSTLLFAAQVRAEGGQIADKAVAHSHDHDSAHEQSEIYKGYFDDEQVEARELSDWEGDWQSVYPLLMSGTLDPVMEHKAEHGGKSAQEYRAYYETGYRTDVDRITISGDLVTFYAEGGAVAGHYAADGYELLTYEAGNRGVRYIFEKTEGDDEAPGFIQFSDHRIAPEGASHYHLYWGDERANLLKEVTNWPTYYPSSLSGEQIAGEMMAH
ncbi:ZinT family metal-binding protein [Roseibium salinum]|uniref:Metal-binding protein ZinT n=1 Tax=Roseibium salinum TaxID=1604349 RepID=A0ABT3QXI1_9HYPH|nr:metal-binding protein ZinT [Roseibium sp. DSM 29163]MCX2721561.1 metal-binding protein ZinT [Roseibium sp. DSM 29163]